jgi:hypothetical protein
MDPKRIRTLLGLAEDASDTDVEAALKDRGLTLEQFEAAHKDAPAKAEDAKPAASEAELPVRHGDKPVILAADRTPKLAPGDGGKLVLAMIRAQNGDAEAAKIVQAALSVVVSTDVPGLMPVAHTNEILGGLEQVDRPLHDAFVERPMPDAGMKISSPSWTTKPLGGWVAEAVDIPSNKPEIGTEEDDVLEWAYGVAMSYAVATRSSPDAIETIYRAAVEDYYSDYEQKIADLLMANDQAGVAGDGLGQSIAAFFADEKYRPRLLVVAPDIYGDLIDEEGTLKYSSGTIGGAVDNSETAGTIAGLRVVVSAHLPAGAELVTHPRAIIHRETSPVRLTSNVIGALKVELGVTSFAAFQLNRPNAIHSLTPPAGAPAGQSEAKRTATRGGKAKAK